MNKTKTLTAICCAALLAPALYAQRPPAELGSVSARYQFAVSRLSGTGSLQAGQKQAFEYLLELAKLSPSRDFTVEQYFEVHNMLGECYEKGKGVQPNLDLAFRYYLFASVYNEKARLALARIFLKGIDSIGLKANPDAAMFEFFDVFTRNEKRIPEIIAMLRTADKVNDFSNFLERKARAGDPVAAYFLASNPFSGNIFPKEIQKSLEIYELAVRYGDLKAAIDLGDIYTFGKNFIPVDEEKGYAYYDLALASNDTKETAAKRMLRYVEKKNDPYDLFKFNVLANDLRNARKVIRDNVQMSWSAEDIYLKAKEFKDGKVRLKQFDKRAQTDYFERLHMASNAGYFLAVEDYFREAGSREYARMIWALELDPHPEDPDWLYTLSVCYRSGGTDNKSRDFKKSLEYMTAAAEKGHVTSMDLLVKLYTRGGARYGVPEPVPELAQKYTDMLVQHDYKLKYPSYFNAYLEELEKVEGEEYDPTSLDPAFRSIQTSPLAAMALSKIFMKGDTNFKVEKDEMIALILLHEAAANGYEPAVRELAEISKNGIPDVFSANANFAKKYETLLNYIPRYIQNEDGTAAETTAKPAEETAPDRNQPRFPTIRPTIPRRGWTPGMIPGRSGGMMGPGMGSGMGPGMPGTRPGTIPGTIPGTRPGTVPGTIPGTRPGTVPRTVPGTIPGPVPGGMPPAGGMGMGPGMGGMPPVPGGMQGPVRPNAGPAQAGQKADEKPQDKAETEAAEVKTEAEAETEAKTEVEAEPADEEDTL